MALLISSTKIKNSQESSSEYNDKTSLLWSNAHISSVFPEKTKDDPKISIINRHSLDQVSRLLFPSPWKGDVLLH